MCCDLEPGNNTGHYDCVKLLSTLLLLSPARVFAEQDYIGRFDVYNGFAWFDSPSANLTGRGYHLKAGVECQDLACGRPRITYTITFP